MDEEDMLSDDDFKNDQEVQDILSETFSGPMMITRGLQKAQRLAPEARAYIAQELQEKLCEDFNDMDDSKRDRLLLEINELREEAKVITEKLQSNDVELATIAPLFLAIARETSHLIRFISDNARRISPYVRYYAEELAKVDDASPDALPSYILAQTRTLERIVSPQPEPAPAPTTNESPDTLQTLQAKRPPRIRLRPGGG